MNEGMYLKNILNGILKAYQDLHAFAMVHVKNFMNVYAHTLESINEQFVNNLYIILI